MYRVISKLQDNNDDIQFFYDILDQNGLPRIMEDISLNIKNYSSALNAKKFYNLDWFKDQLLSLGAKIKIAILLKQLCESYKVSSNIWNLIEESNPEILEVLDILQNKENFRKNLGD